MHFVLSALLLGAFACPAWAATIEDVRDLAVSIENKVINIREKVSDMQPRVSDIQTKVNDTQTDVTSTVTNVLDIRGRVSVVQTKVDDITVNIAEVMDTLRSGVEVLAGDTLTMVTNAITDIQSRVADELDGFDTFDGPPAEQFRGDLVGFLTNLETIINSLSTLTDNNATFDLARAKNILSNARSQVLYPLYRAFEVSVDFSEISTTLSDAAANLTVLETVFVTPLPSRGSPLPSGGGGAPTVCEVIQDNPNLVQVAATSTGKIAAGLALTGEKLDALGETGSDIDAGLWGFAHLRFKANVVKTMGKLLGGLAATLEKVSEVVEDKISYCEILGRHDQLVAKLNSIQADLAALETMVGGGASQSSVDALAVTLGGLNTAPLDVAVSTRASQAGFDLLATEVDTHQSMMLRMRVELQLSDNTRHPSILFLPEAMGGQLGYVRAVVAETLATNVNAGIYTGTLAGEELEAGDAAASSNDYRGAFDSYRRAYQAIVKWPVTASIGTGEGASAIVINWPSDPGGIYCVESSADLDHWSMVLPKVVGDTGQTEVPLGPGGLIGFYRVFRLSSYDPDVGGS